jgi:hypothetical protein
MDKTLPKGHRSCLSGAFRYTAASNTDIARTFARIRRQTRRQEPQQTAKNVCVLPQRRLSSNQAN